MSETYSGATLVVTGPVTLAEVPRWREALMTALGTGPMVVIDLATSGPWDIAGVQLLLSTLETARRSGPTVRFAHVPDVCKRLAEQAGVWIVLEPALTNPSSEVPGRST